MNKNILNKEELDRIVYDCEAKLNKIDRIDEIDDELEDLDKQRDILKQNLEDLEQNIDELERERDGIELDIKGLNRNRIEEKLEAAKQDLYILDSLKKE